MKIVEKYIEALKTFTDFVTISEWAVKFGEMYPDELEKANEQAHNQKGDTTGLRELAARISSNISSGKWSKELLIDDSERPKKVKYITEDELEVHKQKEIDHAEALLNDDKQGDHHPDNLQLLLKYHNGKKSKKSWQRFTFDEQAEYIKKTISLQSLVADKFDVEIDNKILESLINRLKEVY